MLIRLDGKADGYRRGLSVFADAGIEEWTFDPKENEEAYRLELAGFARACRGEPSYWHSGRECLPTVALLEAARC
mgnify:FL=1